MIELYWPRMKLIVDSVQRVHGGLALAEVLVQVLRDDNRRRALHKALLIGPANARAGALATLPAGFPLLAECSYALAEVLCEEGGHPQFDDFALKGLG